MLLSKQTCAGERVCAFESTIGRAGPESAKANRRRQKCAKLFVDVAEQKNCFRTLTDGPVQKRLETRTIEYEYSEDVAILVRFQPKC